MKLVKQNYNIHKSISTFLSIYVDIYGIISIDDNVTTDVTLSINFVGDKSDVKYLETNNLVINGSSTEVIGNTVESYCVPSGPVSFVAEGYHVVETTEDGVPVFEVVKD